MNSERVQTMLKKCLEEIGIMIEGEDYSQYFLEEYIEDSVMFISMIISLEDTFNISIPDEYLSVDVLSTFQDVVETIENIVNAESIGG